MLPTSLADMAWLRSQIRSTVDSVWEAVTRPSGDGALFRPDLIISNQLAYGQVGGRMAAAFIVIVKLPPHQSQ
jgi:hypothetical protein